MTAKGLRAMALTMLLAAVPAAAQQTSATYGAPIGLEAAKKAVAAAEAEAKKNGWLMVITLIDSGGHLVLAERMDGAQYGSIRVAEGKARTALDFRRSTKAIQDIVAQGGIGLRFLTVPDAFALQGGIPLIVDGKIVGALGVSGGSSEQDEQVAMAGQAAIAK